MAIKIFCKYLTKCRLFLVLIQIFTDFSKKCGQGFCVYFSKPYTLLIFDSAKLYIDLFLWKACQNLNKYLSTQSCKPYILILTSHPKYWNLLDLTISGARNLLLSEIRFCIEKLPNAVKVVGKSCYKLVHVCEGRYDGIIKSICFVK